MMEKIRDLGLSPPFMFGVTQDALGARHYYIGLCSLEEMDKHCRVMREWRNL